MFQEVETEKEWILEAINHLKHRKARPDFSRISLRMKRKHHISFAQTKQLLDSLIERGIVVKAVYKNNTSYRDVSKWKRGRLGGQIMNSNKMLKRFVKAIEDTETVKGTGVSVPEIEAYLAIPRENEEKCGLSGGVLTDALDNEVKNGYLIKRDIDTTTLYAVDPEKVEFLSQLSDGEYDDEEDSHNVSADDSQTSFDSHDVENKELPFMKKVFMIIDSRSVVETGCGGASFEDIKRTLNEQKVSFTDTLLSKGLDQCISKGRIVQVRTLRGKTHFFTKKKDTFNDISVKSLWNGWEMQTMTQYHNSVEAKLANLKPKPSQQAQTNGSEEDKKSVEAEAKPDVKAEVSVFDVVTSKVNSSSNPGVLLNGVPPLRPPSKRKRIMKNHGPDFEMEMPVRTKARLTTGPTTEKTEPAFPTPADSPLSEKSENAIENSFKFESNSKIEFKKKRGRPKIKKEEPLPKAPVRPDSSEENSRQGMSEQSSVTNGDFEDAASLGSSFPDVLGWTPQQVADHFTQKGYVKEAQGMLEHELDGNALCLLKRSDIVGPPLGGMLGISKLGVALKLFRDIRDLVYHGNADNYIDPYQERSFL